MTTWARTGSTTSSQGVEAFVDAWLNGVLPVLSLPKAGCATLGVKLRMMTTASYLTRPVIPGNLNTSESVCLKWKMYYSSPELEVPL